MKTRGLSPCLKITIRPPALELGTKLADQYIQSQVQAGRLLVINHSINMNEKEVLRAQSQVHGDVPQAVARYFVDTADHRYPTLMVDRPTWENGVQSWWFETPLIGLSRATTHCRSAQRRLSKGLSGPKVVRFDGAVLPHDESARAIRHRTPVAVHAPPPV